ncbi:hypothetical protein X801_03359 [Opisthorchis viverrini]|uniref:PDZ domain-containing protein n=1 Tax=Opisthorchis viverrini TaxID=6198 RepID=A0A1S8X208_OPIVI|nr:hypothetical protein X801_03359 [Opisthorchis viverrini]
MSQTFHVSRRTMSLEHTHGQPSPVRLHARCDANVKQPTDSQAGSEDGWILSTAKIPKSLDGRLPDIDYSKMKMRNLDDLNDERILMEFDHNLNYRVYGTDLYLIPEIQLHRRSALTDQIFPLELKKKTSPNSENEDVIVAAPPSDDLVTQLGGPLRLGDQVLQINDTPVYNLAQAQELLRNSGNKICVYVMRPSEKVITDCVPREVSLSVSTPSFGTKEGICFLNGLSVNQASALQVTRDLEHHKGQQSSTILFPHTVYTTRDRLARTIELQQRLLNFKLYKNGVHSTRNNQQLLPCTASQRQDNFWNCLPSQANEYKRRSFNELLASTRNTITSSGVEPSSQWVLKRKTDGTKYITRRIIKRMFDPSVFDIIAFKRGAMLRLVGEILVRDPKTVNLFSLSYGELFLQDSSKLMAKSPSEAWFQRPEWWFSVYMIQVSQFVSFIMTLCEKSESL